MEIEEGPREFRFRVSSNQLRITSAYFREVYNTDSEQIKPDREDGLYHVQAEH